MAEMVGGVLLGPPINHLYEIAVDFAKKYLEFKPTLDRIADTLNSLRSTCREMTDLNIGLNLPGGEIGRYRALTDEGEQLVLKCSQIKRHKRSSYTNKLLAWEEKLLKFYQMNVQAQLWARGHLTLKGMEELKLKLDQIDRKLDRVVLNTDQIVANTEQLVQWTKSNNQFQGSGGFPGSCAVPRLPEFTVGLDEPVKKLKQMFLENDLSVVVISGMPGCGKTTLATKFCHDDEVTGKFGPKIFFVTVSGTPNVKLIVQRLFGALGYQQQAEFPSYEDVVNELKKLIEAIGCGDMLLVLDDIWPGWEFLVRYFDFKIPGYKLLVTSRSKFQGFNPYQLKLLNEKDARSLFCHTAFPSGSIPSSTGLQELVHKIVQSCRESPLLLTVVGGLLRGQNDSEWNSALQNWSKILDTNRDLLDRLQPCLDALDNLPEVKKCYLDLGSFPEDQRVPTTVLRDIGVELYGYKEDGKETLVSLNKLATRNLINFMLTREDATEIEGSFNDHYVWQHDVLRQLVIHYNSKKLVEQRERLNVDVQENEFPSWLVEQENKAMNAQLLSISTDEKFSSSWCNLCLPNAKVLILNLRTRNYKLPHFLQTMDKLKAMIITNYGISVTELGNFELLGKLTDLRRIRFEHVTVPLNMLTSAMGNLRKMSFVMCKVAQAFNNCPVDMANIFPNLVDIDINRSDDLKEWPEALSKIVSLRRLRITYCQELLVLPEELEWPKNLEALTLNSCLKIKRLPKSIRQLRNLRFLDITDCSGMSELPDEIGELMSLKSLHMRCCGGRWGLSKLPPSAKKLRQLEQVICNDQTANIWRTYEIIGLSIHVPEEDTSGSFFRITGRRPN